MISDVGAFTFAVRETGAPDVANPVAGAKTYSSIPRIPGLTDFNSIIVPFSQLKIQSLKYLVLVDSYDMTYWGPANHYDKSEQ